MTVACYICRIPVEEIGNADPKQVDCPRCGKYTITETACSMLTGNPLLSESQVGCASGWVREHTDVEISSEVARSLKGLRPPSPAVKGEKLLVALARLYPTPGEQISLPFPILSSLLSRRMGHPSSSTFPGDEAKVVALTGASWAANSKELWFLLVDYLTDSQKYVLRVGQGDKIFKISPDGWAHLAASNPNSKIGFIAMWFQKELEPVHLAIESGIRAAGYDPKRIDRVEHNNRIDDEIIAWIRRSKFVVADFTGSRGGVYFESGYALGMGLPVIWLCREDDLPNVHFDSQTLFAALGQGTKETAGGEH
jgi:nucleoside 2-deoxyribosyltransferase